MTVGSTACAAGLLLTGAGANDDRPGAASIGAQPGAGAGSPAPARTDAVPAAPVHAPADSGTGGSGMGAGTAGVAPGTATPGTGTATAPGTASPGTGTATAPGGGSPGTGAAPAGGSPGTGTAPGSAPPGTGAAYAGRSRVFGLVEAGTTPQAVRFAPARKAQPGGPETVHPAGVGRYVTLPLAPGAVIRASAPIANEGVTDWVRGIRLTPGEFWVLMRRLQARSHPFRERSHMFELWFDREGRITRMQHYFSP